MDNDLELPQVTWQIENKYPLMVKPLKDALSTVFDPELRLDVLQLGLIRDVIVEENEARIIMVLTTPFCPYAPTLMEAIREKAEQVLERPIKVELSNEPWLPTYMSEELRDSWGLF